MGGGSTTALRRDRPTQTPDTQASLAPSLRKMMGSALRRLAPSRAHLAVAGGIALSAYVLQQQYPVKAAEPEAIFVING